MDQRPWDPHTAPRVEKPVKPGRRPKKDRPEAEKPREETANPNRPEPET